MVQYVTSTPIVKVDVVGLQENLNRRLETEQKKKMVYIL